MKKIILTLPEMHPAQLQIDGELKRFNVLNCGRRFGKDVYCMNKLIEPALAGYPVAWFAPTYKMLNENWKNLRHILLPVAKPHEQEKQLDLITGGIVDMWSLEDPDAARGRKYKRIVINEAAKVKSLMDAWNMVIRPTLADYKGDAFFPSTPKGLNGFYTLWARAESDPEWARWRRTTSDNPYIDPGEIEAMKRELPERVYRQEILAEFIEDGAYFQGVDAAAIVEVPDKTEDHTGHNLVMAADWGLSGDFTVIGIGCRECNRVVDWDVFTNMDFTYQRERLYALHDRWMPASVLPERNSFGEPNIELIMQRGISVMYGPDSKPGFNTSATTKPPLIQGLATAIEHHGYKVPRIAADELRMYEVESMASGHLKFGAPAGSHDDWVMMLALLWHAMSNSSVQFF